MTDNNKVRVRYVCYKCQTQNDQYVEVSEPNYVHSFNLQVKTAEAVCQNVKCQAKNVVDVHV